MNINSTWYEHQYTASSWKSMEKSRKMF